MSILNVKPEPGDEEAKVQTPLTALQFKSNGLPKDSKLLCPGKTATPTKKLKV